MKLLTRLRPRLSYANVIATLALFLVLGGGAAFAATQLPKNSVGSKQLKKHAVTPSKLAPATISQLKGATGPQGPKGARGAKGDTGARGLIGPVGPKGDAGAAGKDAGPFYLGGPSGEGVEFPQGKEAEVRMATLKNLPAGSYAISFKGQLISANQETFFGGCEIEAGAQEPSGGTPDFTLFATPEVVGVPFTTSVVLQGAATFANDGGELFVSCEVSEGEVEESPSTPGGSAAAMLAPKLSATKVPSLSLQEEEVEAASALSKAEVRKLGFKG